MYRDSDLFRDLSTLIREHFYRMPLSSFHIIKFNIKLGARAKVSIFQRDLIIGYFSYQNPVLHILQYQHSTVQDWKFIQLQLDSLKKKKSKHFAYVMASIITNGIQKCINWGSSIMGSVKSASTRVIEGRVELGFAVLASSEIDAVLLVESWAAPDWWELEQACVCGVGFWWRCALRLQSKGLFPAMSPPDQRFISAFPMMRPGQRSHVRDFTLIKTIFKCLKYLDH